MSAQGSSPLEESIPEFTAKAVVAGVVLGLVFGAANAYLGLRVGMTVSASIPAAVMTVAVFRLLGPKGSILEANLSQTIGSASTSLATGTIFTIPALFLWGVAPPYLQVVVLCFLGALLGLSAMIPLRRLLIVDAHAELPYPEGTACAEVLRATAADSSGSVWIFRGMAVGAAVKLVVGLFFLVPGEIGTALPFLPKAEIAIELAPALLAVGFILGYRQSGILVAGSIVSSLVLIPLIAFVGAGLAAPLAPGDREARLRDVGGRDLVAVRAVHRRGRSRDRRDPDGPEEPPDDGGRVSCRDSRRAGRRRARGRRARGRTAISRAGSSSAGS